MNTKHAPCDECEKCNSVTSHMLIKYVNLCRDCRRKSKDDDLEDERCFGEKDLESSELIETLGDANDLLTCLYIILQGVEHKNFDGTPHITLLEKIGSHINYVMKNLSE